jgi:hypothetical protein
MQFSILSLSLYFQLPDLGDQYSTIIKKNRDIDIDSNFKEATREGDQAAKRQKTERECKAACCRRESNEAHNQISP